jgi:hypothetical protein
MRLHFATYDEGPGLAIGINKALSLRRLIEDVRAGIIRSLGGWVLARFCGIPEGYK